MSDLNETLAEEQKEIDALTAMAAASGADEGAATTAVPSPEPERKMVPLAALHAERATRKELQQRLAQADERFQQFMAAKAAQAAQAQAAPAPAEPPPPSFDANPTAHLKAETESTKKTVEQIRAALAQRQLAELRAAAQEQFTSRYHAAARDFAARTPDFMDAYKHACGDRDSELAELGYGDPELRRQIIAAEEAAIVGRALNDGVNPAERIYKLAHRRGYRGAAQRDAAARLEALARNQAMARSLSGAGGAAPMPPRLEDLANMSDDEFAAATRGANWRRLLQG
jgi:hypothetical protein